MNKAEKQYVYWVNRLETQQQIMAWGWNNRNKHRYSFAKYLKEYIETMSQDDMIDGQKDYYNTFLSAIKLGLFTDWPSFVTYMTGEIYE